MRAEVGGSLALDDRDDPTRAAALGFVRTQEGRGGRSLVVPGLETFLSLNWHPRWRTLLGAEMEFAPKNSAWWRAGLGFRISRNMELRFEKRQESWVAVSAHF